MGEAQSHFEDLSLGLGLVTDTDKFLHRFKTFAHALHHVVDDGTVESVHGARLASGGSLVGLHVELAVFHLEDDSVAVLLRKFT